MNSAAVIELARDAIEDSPGFDPDMDDITYIQVIRSSQEIDGEHIYVHAVVVTDVDELQVDTRVPVETVQVIIRDLEVISTERLSLHLI